MLQKPQGLAIASLVLGVASIFLSFTLIIPIAGIIISAIALTNISKGFHSGKGLAIGGLVTSIVGIMLFIFYFLGTLAFVSYSPLVDKGYAAEAETYLKEVSAAVTLWEDTYGGQQPSMDDLKSRGILKPSEALERNWTIEFSGNTFSATSTEEMPGGGGNTTIYNRQTGTFSGYGFE